MHCLMLLTAPLVEKIIQNTDFVVVKLNEECLTCNSKNVTYLH